jgi:hypothetical protein
LRQDSVQNYNGKRPDILIYSHVLEHTRLPSELLNIKKVCSEKTVIYVEVPGLLSVHKYDPDFIQYLHIAHLYHFSLNVLIHLFSKYGFSFLCGNENIQSLFVCNQDMNDEREFKNHYDENVIYLKNVEKFRLINRVLKSIRSCIISFLKRINMYEKIRKIKHKLNRQIIGGNIK